MSPGSIWVIDVFESANGVAHDRPHIIHHIVKSYKDLATDEARTRTGCALETSRIRFPLVVQYTAGRMRLTDSTSSHRII